LTQTESGKRFSVGFAVASHLQVLNQFGVEGGREVFTVIFLNFFYFF
jgi:hypothetical protein